MAKSHKHEIDGNSTPHRKLSHEELKAQRRQSTSETKPAPSIIENDDGQVYCVFKFMRGRTDRDKYIVSTVGRAPYGYDEVRYSRTLHEGRARMMALSLNENKGLGGFVQAKAGEVQESWRRIRERVIARYHQAQRLAEIGFWDRYEQMLADVRS